MYRIPKIVFFLVALLLVSCDKKYSYIEIVKEKGLMNDLYTEKSLDPETITAINDSLAYLKAYEKYCISVCANKKASKSLGYSFGEPSSFKLLNSDGLDVYVTANVDPNAISEIENRILESTGCAVSERTPAHIEAISIGDTIILHKKEEWNVKQKEFVPATKTSLYGNKKSLTSDYFIKSFPNGTKAVVLDYYEEKLVNGSLWKVYKVKAESSEGWVADFEIEKIN